MCWYGNSQISLYFQYGTRMNKKNKKNMTRQARSSTFTATASDVSRNWSKPDATLYSFCTNNEPKPTVEPRAFRGSRVSVERWYRAIVTKSRGHTPLAPLTQLFGSFEWLFQPLLLSSSNLSSTFHGTTSYSTALERAHQNVTAKPPLSNVQIIHDSDQVYPTRSETPTAGPDWHGH